MEKSHYSGATPPPRSNRLDIVRVTSSESQTFVILSRTIYAQYIHWYGGRSHECSEGKKACQGCGNAWPKKFLGYIHATKFGQQNTLFLELTHTACEMLIAQAHANATLRGTQVRISKTKGGAKGRYRVEVLERTFTDEELPPEKDPLETLRFLWKCKNHLTETPSQA